MIPTDLFKRKPVVQCLHFKLQHEDGSMRITLGKDSVTSTRIIDRRTGGKLKRGICVGLPNVDQRRRRPDCVFRGRKRKYSRQVIDTLALKEYSELKIVLCRTPREAH
jgi:hypothetical protein